MWTICGNMARLFTVFAPKVSVWSRRCSLCGFIALQDRTSKYVMSWLFTYFACGCRWALSIRHTWSCLRGTFLTFRRMLPRWPRFLRCTGSLLLIPLQFSFQFVLGLYKRCSKIINNAHFAVNLDAFQSMYWEKKRKACSPLTPQEFQARWFLYCTDKVA